MRESTTGIIEHSFFDADTLGRMISYTYTQGYVLDKTPTADSNTTSNEDDPQRAGATGDMETFAKPSVSDLITQELLAHARVYGIGEYYDLSNLKTLAVKMFDAVASKYANPSIYWPVEGFVAVAEEVYRLTAPGGNSLKDALTGVVMGCIGVITSSSMFMEVLADADGLQEFTIELLRLSVQKLSDERDRAVEDLKAEQELTLHVKDTTNILVKRVQGIDGLCRNTMCRQRFDWVELEPVGDAGPGGVLSDWQVRCGKCRCKQYV
ncbi:hypothetical protein LTR78_007257 [Recurvomyces mirabilis]|uniref:Uncharacterized protein n=1 Tax=Recurvomyces mirabilis TaxID=574656 RepID=A0AAE1BYW5_9PEZI|nr:hypothetical protein LTR78_007257 [Recurvomyces mirabilis]KAK5155500.1 hypothetical protein LTS14_005761 [Recurvomyces mirabilis]